MNTFAVYPSYYYCEEEDLKEHIAYITTSMDLSTLEDVIAGIYFYLEDCTQYGVYACAPGFMGDVILYILYNYFYCHKGYPDIKTRELCLYDTKAGRYERRINCMRPVLDISDYPFMRKVCRFFNDESAFEKPLIRILTPQEIIARY